MVFLARYVDYNKGVFVSVNYKHTGLTFQVWVSWWGSGDSNPDAFRHMILSHARLPIPALPRFESTY